MNNPLKLLTNKTYKVIQPFADYDQYQHEVGETWTFVKTNFLPYDDGLTLHVLQNGSSVEKVYRLQWRPDQQAQVIEHFNEYVVLC